MYVVFSKVIRKPKFCRGSILPFVANEQEVEKILHVDFDFSDFTIGLKFLYTKFSRDNVTFGNSFVNLVDGVCFFCCLLACLFSQLNYIHCVNVEFKLSHR